MLWIMMAGMGIASAASQPNKRPTDMQRGKTLYTRHCQACHGPGAAGDGPATEALVHPVPDLSGEGKVSSAQRYIDVVLRGKKTMPGFEPSFDKRDASRVLRYMAAAARSGGPVDVGDAPEKKAPAKSAIDKAVEAKKTAPKPSPKGDEAAPKPAPKAPEKADD